MKVYHTTVEQLEQAAAQIPCKLFNLSEHGVDNKYFTCVLRPTPETPERLRKTGDHDRRVNALSWYGHKVFYDALFALVPQAKIMTNYWSQAIVYDGVDSYKAQVHG